MSVREAATAAATVAVDTGCVAVAVDTPCAVAVAAAAATTALIEVVVDTRCAVVVVEGLKAGTKALGVVTEDNSSFTVEVKDDIPIGHKVALVDLPEGTTVIKYGQDVGKLVAAATKGRHVHTHNMKTKRW